MFKKGLVKRLLPFFVALALGLFVASFFVSLALPNVRPVRGWRNHRQYHQMMEAENQRLRERNFQLEREVLKYKTQQSEDLGNDLKDMVPPPPPMAPRAGR